MTNRLFTTVVISLGLAAACSQKSAAPESESAANVATGTEQTTVVAEPVPPPLPAEPPLPPEPPLPNDPTPPPPPTLTDAQIVKVVDVVNTGEIEQGKLAQKRAQHPSVKKFAQQMVQQHTKALQKTKAAAKKATLTPETSLVADELSSASQTQLDKLKSAAPGEFDALYMDGQLMQHERALAMLNEQLIPTASQQALKDQLGETRSLIEAHIASAKQVQQTLESGAPGKPGAATGAPQPSAQAPQAP